MIDISIIIPVWRGALVFLPKLLSTIPQDERIEVVVVDNSKEPLTREEIDSNTKYTLLYSPPERHAGGSRNVGIEKSKGRWIIFADADDFFSDDAFDIFYSHIDSDAEIIFTKPMGIYADTGEKSYRGDGLAQLVHNYTVGLVSEEDLRLGFETPWCKMISRELVDRENLRFDEIRAGNDIYFSLTTGYFANKIESDDRITYYVTVNKGSLTQHRDYEVIRARLEGKLHCNQFLKEHGLGYRQRSIMFALKESIHYGLKPFFEMCSMIIKARQNPFVGWHRWMGTFKESRKRNKQNSQYIVR